MFVVGFKVFEGNHVEKNKKILYYSPSNMYTYRTYMRFKFMFINMIFLYRYYNH